MSLIKKLFSATVDTVLLPFDVVLDAYGFVTDGDTYNTVRSLHVIGYNLKDGFQDAGKGRILK